MKELQFDTGIVNYRVNGTCEISFNPGDISFAKKLFDLFERLTAQQDSAEKDNEQEIDGLKLFEMTEKRDAEMRQDIDSIFGEGVADALFPNISVFALAGGFPLWANFCMAIIDEIDVNLKAEEVKGRERVDKYMKKYQAYKKRR
jgi:hypothetical protein